MGDAGNKRYAKGKKFDNQDGDIPNLFLHSRKGTQINRSTSPGFQ